MGGGVKVAVWFAWVNIHVRWHTLTLFSYTSTMKQKIKSTKNFFETQNPS